jgi:glycerol kinase
MRLSRTHREAPAIAPGFSLFTGLFTPYDQTSRRQRMYRIRRATTQREPTGAAGK